MRQLVLCLAMLVFCAPPVVAKGDTSAGRSKAKKSKTSNRAAGTSRASRKKCGKRPRRGAKRRRGTRERARARTESQEGTFTPERRASPRRSGSRSPRVSPERRGSMRKRENKMRVRVKEKWTTADGVQRSKVYEVGNRVVPKKTTSGDLLRSGSVSNNGILNAENTLATVKAAESLAKINKLSNGRGG